MIFCDVFLDVYYKNSWHKSLALEEVEDLLSDFKNNIIEIEPKEMISIPDCYAYFSEDNNLNRFDCKIYKTLYGTDTWIMLMKDNYEGYALYKNPVTKKFEISWYHSKLKEPLDIKEEEKMISCYYPL